MLPGFRFLFAATLLSISILVFALGAAALLRATHEQFANNPSWRTGPQEQVFAQAPEPAQPVLAALRLEPEPSEPVTSIRDQVPTIGLPESEPEQVVALQPQAAAEARQSEPPAGALTPQDLAIAAATDSTVPAAVTVPAEMTASVPEVKVVAAEATSPATLPDPQSEPQQADAAVVPAPAQIDVTTAKVATLSDPPADTKAANSAPEKATKRHAHRAKKRHRIARRPPPAPVQQTFDPFASQPAVATASTARTR